MSPRQMTPLSSSSFGARLLITSVVNFSVSLSVHAFLNFQSTKQQLLEFVSRGARRSRGMIGQTTRDAVLICEGGDLPQRIGCLGYEPGVAGIAAKLLPLIFEPFDSTKTNERGSGLGLAAGAAT